MKLRQNKQIYVKKITNLFAVKSNTLNRLFHPYGIIRRESKQHTALQKLLLYSKCSTKIFLITLIQKLWALTMGISKKLNYKAFNYKLLSLKMVRFDKKLWII